MKLEDKYNQVCSTPSDINEHLPVLKQYCTGLKHITEMGVRNVCSTFAFLMAKPDYLVSIDMNHPDNYPNGGDNLRIAKEGADELGIDFLFWQADTRKITIDPTEFLFIDTWHVYEQVKEELRLHADKVSKYIGFHDTTTFATRGESGGHMGLWPAIEEFLAEHPEWQIDIRKENNNGLTILKRV